MPRWRASTDANQVEIMAALRAAHWHVVDTHRLGQGYPDLHACRDGVAILVECKLPGEKLNPIEAEFQRLWDAPYLVATSGQEAVDQATRLLWRNTR